MRNWLMMLAAGVALVACEPGDGGGPVAVDQLPYVDALVESAAANPADRFQLNEREAACVAPIWIDVIGVDRLQRARVSPEQLSQDDLAKVASLGLTDDDASAMYGAFDDCGIDIRDSFYESLAELAAITSSDDQQCTIDAVSDELLVRIVTTGFTAGAAGIENDEEVQRGVRSVTDACPDVPASAVIVLAVGGQ